MSKAETRKDGPQGTRIFRFEDVPKVDMQAAAMNEVELTGKKATLSCLTEPHLGKVYVLSKERNTIGRDKDNDIVLDDATVSSIHCRMVQNEGTWKVVNLLSSNGTFINGEKISQHAIKNGDRIRFGDVAFTFESISDAPSRLGNKSVYGALAAIAIGIMAYFVW